MKSNYLLFKKSSCLFFIIIFCSIGGLKAQNNGTIITGKVAGENGKALPGVSIILSGGNTTTITKEDGTYSIQVPSRKGNLVFSSVGYESQEVSIGNKAVINVTLGISQKALQDVVVVGYGSQLKKDMTGSVAQLDASKFEERPISQIGEAMQGQMAGVQVRATSGAPGSDVQIKVRGTASVNAGTDPLYVVDGVPIDNLSDINPTDIASIDVLKDAASTAIYGSRATNGVVLITTKKGHSGKTRFNFSSYYGIQQLANKMDLLNGPEWINMYEQAQDSAYVKRG
ncbi:MAG: TonB-dependent receptor plug domain-containing protein, partial [Ginsengibacter sp.]